MVLGGFSSSSSSCFPEGLRVLVVDHDPQSLKNLQKLLNRCKYEVTTCALTQEALKLLGERLDEFDIVISDVNMPDMDGFEFLQHVRVQMDIPVILMSANGERSSVMRGAELGACDYLLKPIRLKELRNIWQHVFRKRMHRIRDIERPNEIKTMRTEIEQSDTMIGEKRKEVEDRNHSSEHGDSSAKKPRVVWTADLHQKFVKAVNEIGSDKAGPKKILELMEVPWLRRENVASHLQKYRLHLSRMQKVKELQTTSGGIKHSGISSEDIYFQRSINQNFVTTENYARGHHMHDVSICKGNVNTIFSTPMALEANNALFGDVIDPSIGTPSGISFNQSFGPPDSEVNSQLMIQNQFTWSAKVPSVQFQQQLKPHHNIGEVTKVENAAGFYADQLQSHLTFNPIASSIWSKNHVLEQNQHDNLLNLDGFSSLGEFYAQYHEAINFESFGDVPPNLYDSSDFGFENMSDPVKNLVIDPVRPQ